MKQKLIIASETIASSRTGSPCCFQICALCEDRRMIEASVQPEKSESILNNIYIGRVKNIASNINAAFVEIAGGRICYLPLEDLKNPVFTKKGSDKPLAAGDELAVQVVKEAMKLKDARVTTNLRISGEYAVLTSGRRETGISSKISGKDRMRLRELAVQLEAEIPCSDGKRQFGLIIRTNAAGAGEADVRADFQRILDELSQIIAHAASRTVFSCLYKEQPFYMKMLRDADKTLLEEAVTDDAQVYEQIKAYARDSLKVRFYEDSMLSLARLYNLAGQLEAAFYTRVWLKSGANIVIEHTEALTVIDVNSGRNVSKKDKQETHFKINLEAAQEIARQLRLRNLSGIIIVDFIDMYDKERNAALLQHFGSCLKEDPVPSEIAGLTRLGLVELTRKKVKKPLAEQMNGNFSDF